MIISPILCTNPDCSTPACFIDAEKRWWCLGCALANWKARWGDPLTPQDEAEPYDGGQ